MKKRRSVMQAAFLATLSLIMTMAVAASLTFALFFDTAESKNNKVQAGNLTIEVDLIDRGGSELDPTTGKLKPIVYNEDPISLIGVTDPMFEFENAVPGQSQSATVKIVNTGIVAFNYDLTLSNVTLHEVEVNGEKNTDRSEALAKQIKITISAVDKDGNVVKDGNGADLVVEGWLNGAVGGNFTLSDPGFELPPNTNLDYPTVQGSVPSASSIAYFKIEAKFEDDRNSQDGKINGTTNNEAEFGKVTFDITITATQAT